MYKLKFNSARIKEMADSSGGIKSLAQEITVLRSIFETIYNRCNDDTDIALHATPMGDMIMKIERLVTSAHKLDKDLGVMMDEAQVVALAQEFIEIVARHVQDVTVLEEIANEIATTVENRGHNRVQ